MTINLAVDGLHPTTVSCMEALQWLAERRQFTRVLDMGCGDAMLSILAVHFWQADVLAVDISEKAVSDAKTQVAMMMMGDAITVLRGDGFSDPAIAARAAYDLIVFNLLAEPVMEHAPKVKGLMAGNGVCITSGILSWLEAEVVRMYEGLGFRLLQRISREPWQTLVWEAF